MSLPNKQFINMDELPDGTWWVDYLDTSREHPQFVREIFASRAEADVFYWALVTPASDE